MLGHRVWRECDAPLDAWAAARDETLMGPAARVLDREYVGIRPGERIHEVLVSEEEAARTYERGDHLVVAPILPEQRSDTVDGEPFAGHEFTSAVLAPDAVAALLERHGLLFAQHRTPA